MAEFMRHPELEVVDFAVEVEVYPGGHGVRQKEVQCVFVPFFGAPEYWNQHRLQFCELLDEVVKVDAPSRCNTDFLTDFRRDFLNVVVVEVGLFQSGGPYQLIEGEVRCQWTQQPTHFLRVADVLLGGFVCTFLAERDHGLCLVGGFEDDLVEL